MGNNKIVTQTEDWRGRPRVQPDIPSEHHKEIDGLEIIAREMAVSPHPRWGMKHPATHHFITRLLLADGTDRFECNHCHLADPELKSIKGHLSTHRTVPPQPLTDVETIKTVLREVERARRLYGVGNYCKYAVEALTRLGVRPAKGGEWTAQAVSSLYNAWKDRYPVRAPKVQQARRKVNATPKPKTIPAPPLQPFSDLVDHVGTEKAHLIKLRDQLLAGVDLLEQMIAAPPPPQVIDEALADKARQFDQLKKLLG